MKKFYTLLTITILLRSASFAQYSWSNVGSGMNSPVQSLVADSINNIVYAGGLFTQAGGVPAINIAKWNGSTWAPLGSGIVSGVGISSMLIQGTDLIAGGTFTNISGVLSKNIARWDGLAWLPIGAGLEYTGATTVSTMTIYNGDLYAGGTFNNSGGSPVNNIARWDGTNWQPLTSGTNGPVLSLCVFGSDLYVGGSFTDAGGVAVNNIAKWNGSGWADVGGGMSYTGATTVSTMTVYNGDLYAGGMFNMAGAASVNHIAKWDGTGWSDVGGGAGNYTGATTVSTFTVFNSELVVGGNIDSLGALPVNYIGKWDGTTWSALGSGTNNTVLSLTALHDTLYAGGLFPAAGGIVTPFIAEWIPAAAAFISISDRESGKGVFTLYPNPMQNQLFVRSNHENFTKGKKTYSFILFDIMGREVYQTNHMKNEMLIDRDHIPAGLYIYKIMSSDNEMVQQGKLSLR